MFEGEKNSWLYLDSLEPAAIWFTFKHLQESARQLGCFSLLHNFKCLWFHWNPGEWFIIFNYVSMWNLMDIIICIRLTAQGWRYVLCRTLDPTACSKMLSKKQFWRGREILGSLLLAAIWIILECFNTSNQDAFSLLISSTCRHMHWTQESRGVHNHMVLDVQLQTSQLWNLLRFWNSTGL